MSKTEEMNAALLRGWEDSILARAKEIEDLLTQAATIRAQREAEATSA
jgi:hypothetical protein